MVEGFQITPESVLFSISILFNLIIILLYIKLNKGVSLSKDNQELIKSLIIDTNDKVISQLTDTKYNLEFNKIFDELNKLKIDLTCLTPIDTSYKFDEIRSEIKEIQSNIIEETTNIKSYNLSELERISNDLKFIMLNSKPTEIVQVNVPIQEPLQIPASIVNANPIINLDLNELIKTVSTECDKIDYELKAININIQKDFKNVDNSILFNFNNIVDEFKKLNSNITYLMNINNSQIDEFKKLLGTKKEIIIDNKEINSVLAIINNQLDVLNQNIVSQSTILYDKLNNIESSYENQFETFSNYINGIKEQIYIGNHDENDLLLEYIRQVQKTLNDLGMVLFEKLHETYNTEPVSIDISPQLHNVELKLDKLIENESVINLLKQYISNYTSNTNRIFDSLEDLGIIKSKVYAIPDNLIEQIKALEYISNENLIEKLSSKQEITNILNSVINSYTQLEELIHSNLIDILTDNKNNSIDLNDKIVESRDVIISNLKNIPMIDEKLISDIERIKIITETHIISPIREIIGILQIIGEKISESNQLS
jgi:hypothetical protein